MADTPFKSIKIDGRLDTTRVGQVETPFFAQIGGAKGPSDKVLIDMSGVDFISSLGIRMLIVAGKTLSQRKVPMGILAPSSDSVMEAMRVAGLPDVFRFFPSEEAARRGL
jgi:anti-sigma B factor antagonist